MGFDCLMVIWDGCLIHEHTFIGLKTTKQRVVCSLFCSYVLYIHAHESIAWIFWLFVVHGLDMKSDDGLVFVHSGFPSSSPGDLSDVSAASAASLAQNHR